MPTKENEAFLNQLTTQKEIESVIAELEDIQDKDKIILASLGAKSNEMTANDIIKYLKNKIESVSK